MEIAMISWGIRATSTDTVVTIMIVARDNRQWATVDACARELQRRHELAKPTDYSKRMDMSLGDILADALYHANKS